MLHQSKNAALSSSSFLLGCVRRKRHLELCIYIYSYFNYIKVYFVSHPSLKRKWRTRSVIEYVIHLFSAFSLCLNDSKLSLDLVLYQNQRPF